MDLSYIKKKGGTIQCSYLSSPIAALHIIEAYTNTKPGSAKTNGRFF